MGEVDSSINILVSWERRKWGINSYWRDSRFVESDLKSNVIFKMWVKKIGFGSDWKTVESISAKKVRFGILTKIRARLIFRERGYAFSLSQQFPLQSLLFQQGFEYNNIIKSLVPLISFEVVKKQPPQTHNLFIFLLKFWTPKLFVL
jgi:hypothetical protein